MDTNEFKKKLISEFGEEFGTIIPLIVDRAIAEISKSVVAPKESIPEGITIHTKGEWFVKGDKYPTIQSRHTGDGIRTYPTIATVNSTFIEHDEYIDNAKLIAAAPELLEACVEALKHHQGGHSEIGYMLRNAIQKATK